MRSDKRKRWPRWVLNMVLLWFLLINAVFYWNILNDRAPGILKALEFEWLR